MRINMSFQDLVFFFLWTILAIVVLFVVVFIFTLLRDLISSVISRCRFCFLLYKLCKDHRYTYRKKHSIIRSLFFSYSGEDIAVEYDGRTIYLLKFFPFLIRHKRVFLTDDQHALISSRIALGTKYSEGRRRMMPPADGAPIISQTIFTIKRKIDLSFSSDTEKKILLISNGNNDIHFFAHGVQFVDNGVEYKDNMFFYQMKQFIKKMRKEEF